MQPQVETVAKTWEACRACVIGSFAFRHVFGKGTTPAKFLFIGEGPDVSEDALGEPFVGPSGRLLREALGEAGFCSSDIFITNLVACRPTDKLGGNNRAPTHEEIRKCSPRLKAIISLVKPLLIVAVGNVADAELQENYSNHHIWKIRHPAFILRHGGKSSEMYKAWLKELKSIRSFKRKR